MWKCEWVGVVLAERWSESGTVTVVLYDRWAERNAPD